MRRLRIIVAIVGLALASHHGLRGQTPPGGLAQTPGYPSQLQILTSQADIFSGPSPSYYPTSRLRYGDRVVVLGESRKQPGWLEILPPPGSFSWIEGRYVKLVPGVDKIGIVDAGDPKGTVPVLPGSMVVSKEPNVEIARVPTGTQVLLVDRVQASSNGATWYPIAPVATEVRFLPMDAVRPGSTTVASNPWNSAPVTPTSGSTWPQPQSQPQPQPQVPNPNSVVQLNQLAEQALASGNLDRARLLYLEALNQTTDPAWRTYLQNQLGRLTSTSSWNPTSTQGYPSNPTTPTTPAYPAPTYPAQGPSPFTPASNTGFRPVGSEPAARPGAEVPGQKTWSPWGVLRTTTFSTRDGQPMYVLESRDSRTPVMYVTTQPGMSLREYVGQTLCLYGAMGYRNDDYVRMQYLVAEQIATPPAR